jgi:hypothetical protein
MQQIPMSVVQVADVTTFVGVPQKIADSNEYVNFHPQLDNIHTFRPVRKR